MNLYFTIKTLHILSATLMVGTGFGSAFYLFWAVNGHLKVHHYGHLKVHHFKSGF